MSHVQQLIRNAEKRGANRQGDLPELDLSAENIQDRKPGWVWLLLLASMAFMAAGVHFISQAF